MDDEMKIVYMWMLIFFLFEGNQQVLAPEYTETAQSCKEQAEAIQTVAAEENCVVVLDLPAKTTGYIHTPTTFCVAGSSHCTVAQVKIGNENLITSPQTDVSVNGQDVLVASVTINDTSWKDNGTIIQFVLFPGLVYTSSTVLLVKEAPKAVLLVSQLTCDGTNISWTTNIEDDVDQYIMSIQCDGGYSSTFTLQPNSSSVLLKTSDFPNDSVCAVSMLAHNPAGWSKNQTIEVTIREDIKQSVRNITMLLVHHYDSVDMVVGVMLSNNTCERYLPTWIQFTYDESCDSGNIVNKTLPFRSVISTLVVASFPKHKPHCNIKVDLWNSVSNITHNTTTDTFETTALHIVQKQPGQYFLQCDFKNGSSGNGCAILIILLVDDYIKIRTEGHMWELPGPMLPMDNVYDVYVFDWAPSPNSTSEFYGVVFTTTFHVVIEPSMMGPTVTMTSTPRDNGKDGATTKIWLIVCGLIIICIILVGFVALFILCYCICRQRNYVKVKLQTSTNPEPSTAEANSTSFTEPNSESELLRYPHGSQNTKQLDEGTNNMSGQMIANGNLPSSLPFTEVSESGHSVESGMIVTEEQGKSTAVHYCVGHKNVSSQSANTSQKLYLVPENVHSTERSTRTNVIPDSDYQEAFFTKAKQEDGEN